MFKKFSIALLAVALSGCGHIAVYSNADLTGQETGVKFYTPKPYVLVSRTGAKDKPVDIQLIYLPDIENPLYAKLIAGLGSSDLSLGLSNGMLTTVGQKTDPKLPELVKELVGIPTGLATADKTRAEADKLRKQASSEEIAQAATDVGAIASQVSATLADNDAQSVTTTQQRQGLRTVAQSLSSQANALAAPGAEANLSNIIKALEGTSKQFDAVKATGTQADSEIGKRIWGQISASQESLKKVIDTLKPKAADKPVLTLYEVIMSGGKTTLREVPIN